MTKPMWAVTLSTADAVRSLHADVRKTIDAGAKLLTGGKPVERLGNFYAPTVLTNIPVALFGYHAYREELFGNAGSVVFSA